MEPNQESNSRKTGSTTEPGEPTETMKSTTPERSNPHPKQTAEVPLGTGNQSEPPGGGGRESQKKH